MSQVEQVNRLIDALGERMEKQDWIDFLEQIASDCEMKAEAAKEEMRDG